MHERDLFAVEEGIRYPEKTRAGCHRASEEDAEPVKARAEQLAKPGKALRSARNPVGALYRPAFE